MYRISQSLRSQFLQRRSKQLRRSGVGGEAFPIGALKTVELNRHGAHNDSSGCKLLGRRKTRSESSVCVRRNARDRSGTQYDKADDAVRRKSIAARRHQLLDDVAGIAMTSLVLAGRENWLTVRAACSRRTTGSTAFAPPPCVSARNLGQHTKRVQLRARAFQWAAMSKS